MEQCEEAGCVGQTAGGASAGHRGGRPASKVCLIRCGAAHLPGALPQQRALQVEYIPALIPLLEPFILTPHVTKQCKKVYYTLLFCFKQIYGQKCLKVWTL